MFDILIRYSNHCVLEQTNNSTLQVEVRQSSVLSGPNYLELSGLKSSRRYDIWVKAETSAGYGPSSKVTSVVLSSAGEN